MTTPSLVCVGVVIGGGGVGVYTSLVCVDIGCCCSGLGGNVGGHGLSAGGLSRE